MEDDWVLVDEVEKEEGEFVVVEPDKPTTTPPREQAAPTPKPPPPRPSGPPESVWV